MQATPERGVGARVLRPPSSASRAGVLRRLRRVVGRSPVARVVPRAREWEYVPEGWARGRRRPRTAGWEQASILDSYRAKLVSFAEAAEGPGPLALPTSASAPSKTPSVEEQGSILAYAYALLLASRRSEHVSVLDWGGGIGVYALLARALLPSEVRVEYHCRELPLVCASGREELPEVRFHEDDECLERRYDLVLASSSLQYAEDWRRVLHRLCSATGGYLYLARIPLVRASPSFVVRQRARSYGFGDEYLSWVFSRSELLGCAEGAGLVLVREFLHAHRPRIFGAPEQSEARGFLFRASPSSRLPG